MDMNTGMAGMTGMSMATSTGMNTGMSMTPTGSSSGAMSTSSSSMGGMDMGGMDMGMGSCKITMLWNWNTIDACFLSQSWHITSRGMFAGSCIGVICLVLCLEFLRRISREYDAFIIRRHRLRAQYLGGGSGLRSKLSSSSPSTSLLPKPAPESDDLRPASGLEGGGGGGRGEGGGGEAGGDYGASCCYPQAPAADPDPVPAGLETQTLVRPTLVEHTIRAILHMLQFAVAYFVMLLAMYFNGYIIICIFIGAFLGAFLFSWEPMVIRQENDASAVTKCCG